MVSVLQRPDFLLFGIRQVKEQGRQNQKADIVHFLRALFGDQMCHAASVHLMLCVKMTATQDFVRGAARLHRFGFSRAASFLELVVFLMNNDG